MRNLKKRVLSFVSAVAMVATLIPTTGLFANAIDVGESIVLRSTTEEWSNWDNGSGDQDVSFNVETAGKYTLSAVGWGKSDGWLALRLDGTTYYDAAPEQNESDFTKTYSDISLSEGSHTLQYYVKQGKWYNVKLTLTESDAPAEDLKAGITLTTRPNDYSLGSVSISNDTINNDSTLTAIPEDDECPFVNWSIKMSGKDELVLGTNATLKISSVANKINEYVGETGTAVIWANFGKMRYYRYEAEDFTELVSETKYQGVNRNPKYDDPTVVKEGNTGYSEGTASDTVYGSDSKFADGHNAKADGAGYEDVSATITPQFDASWDDYNQVNKYKFNGWSDHNIVVSVPSGLNNPRVSIKFYANCNVKVYADGNQIYGGDEGENPGGDKTLTYSVESGKDSTIILQGDEDGWADIGVEGSIGDNIKVQSAKEGTGDKVKYENWTDKSYSDLKVAPQYSNGQAVALTGPANGLAIPFSLSEARTTDMEIELGYNYGTLNNDNGYTNGDATWKGGLYVNLYYIGDGKGATAENVANYNKLKNLLGASGTGHDEDVWYVSDNATPDAASKQFKSIAGEVVDKAFFQQLKVKSDDGKATLIDASGKVVGEVIDGSDDNSTDQKIILKLPNGSPEGKYVLTLATDQNNWYSNEKDGTDYVNGTVGTAYYDYIQFKTPVVSGKPDPIAVGADFTFTDLATGEKMKNSLKINSFSDIQYSDQSGVTFAPQAPLYLNIQGYNFRGWTIKHDGNVVYDYNTGYSDNKYADLHKAHNDNKYETSGKNDENVEELQRKLFTATAAEINKLGYPSGAKVEFIANYEFKQDPVDLKIKGGHFYVKDGENDTEFKKIVNDPSKYKFFTFDQIKLVADDPNFKYWTLNDMVYSCDSSIIVSAWVDGTFEAHYAGNEPAASAFIDGTKTQVDGFSDVADVPNKQKITFFTAFSVPGAGLNNAIQSNGAQVGIIVSSSKGKDGLLKTSDFVNGSAGLTVPAGCMVVSSNNTNNIVNNEVFLGLYNVKKGKEYYARAFITYEGKTYYSEKVAKVENAGMNPILGYAN